MYIKREPLGRGNLTFRQRKPRFPFLLILAYVLILGAALFVFFRMDQIQPKVLAAFGPSPTPTLSVEELRSMGDAAYQKGDLDQASAYYGEAAQLAPNDVDVLFNYARLLTLTDKTDNLSLALTIADQAIRVAPDDPRGYAAKARALNWSGQVDQSAVEALRAIELDPNYALGHAYLAESYADLRQLRQARDEAELAIQLDPYSVDARRNYAYVLEWYGDYGGAIQQYEQALQLNANLLDLWYGLARNYRGAGMIQQAVDTYNQILMRTPEDPHPYIELGKTWFEVRDDEAAQISLERAVRLVCADCPLHSYQQVEQNGYTVPANELPETIDQSAWLQLGMVYFTRRNYEDSLAIYEELIAWDKAHNADVPIEAYYVTAAAYYYIDHDSNGRPLCDLAIPRAHLALNMYEDQRMDNPTVLKNILSVYVLCRDYANTPPTQPVVFPVGFAEPDVIVQRPGVGGGVVEGDTSGQTTDNSGSSGTNK